MFSVKEVTVTLRKHHTFPLTLCMMSYWTALFANEDWLPLFFADYVVVCPHQCRTIGSSQPCTLATVPLLLTCNREVSPEANELAQTMLLLMCYRGAPKTDHPVYMVAQPQALVDMKHNRWTFWAVEYQTTESHRGQLLHSWI